MEFLKRFEPLWLALVVIGGLSWAIVGLFDRNILADLFNGGTLTDVVYTVIGFAALMLVPAVLDRFHVAEHMHLRGHGA
jgi:uncharacterized membrane protein YuzA (DUF378 family)